MNRGFPLGITAIGFQRRTIMDSPAPFLLLVIPIALAVGLFFRYFAGSLDQDRVKSYVEQRGGRFISAEWAPFGPGWFGEKNDRIYQVRYYDYDGNEHEAYAKTSMWTGVYFTDDRIVHYASRPVDPEEVESLEDENARLRAELDRLKGKKRDRGSDAIQE
jgi:hypothetical protein